jgi:hypothetical protein
MVWNRAPWLKYALSCALAVNCGRLSLQNLWLESSVAELSPSYWSHRCNLVHLCAIPRRRETYLLQGLGMDGFLSELDHVGWHSLSHQVCRKRLPMLLWYK